TTAFDESPPAPDPLSPPSSPRLPARHGHAAAGHRLGAVVPWLVRTLFQRLEHGGTRADVLLCASAVLGTALFRALFLFASRYLILAASRRIEFDLRNDLYAHLETLSGR